MPAPFPAEPPPARPARRSRRGKALFVIVYVGMLIAGVAIGFRAGSPKPTPPGKPTLVAANKPEATPPVQAPPEPKPKAPEPKPADSKKAEPREPEPKAEPPPEKKPEPKPQPKKVEPPKPSGPEVPFATVAAVFKDKCTACHGGVEPKGGLDLRSAKAAVAGGDSGAGIKPGDPDNSLIWQSIADGTMPPKNKPRLTDAEKKLIKDWIAGGAR
jgi:periplasmic protein TonB